MSVSVAAPEDQRAWWLRTLLVLQAPRPVFAALRDDSPEAADARQEPVTAIVFLAGIAGVLMTPRFGALYDDPAIDAVLVLVLTIFAGSIYGFFVYWLGGWALSRGVRALGAHGDARLGRHVLGFAAAPLALSLIVLPVRLAIYGSDVFRTGGADSSAGGEFLEWLTVAFAAWAIVLLVYGVRTAHRFTWGRAVAASAAAVGLVVAVLGSWVMLQVIGAVE
jgi:hypothetical protein